MKTLILSGFGTNCEKETLYACRRAGGEDADLRHINVIYHEGLDLAQYHLLILIGGFLDGDDLGAARACANRFRFRTLPRGGTFLRDLQKFVVQDRLVLGICNGFQLLVKLGLLPGSEAGARQQLTMAPNANHRFEDRWVDMIVEDRSPCVFTKGIGRIELPVRHGEGRVWAESRDVLERLVEQGLAPLMYCSQDGTPTEAYPANPNGSPLGIAALCNPKGTVMGLMPHPEAYNHYTNHPQWSRRPFQGEDGKGLAILRNAYRHLAQSGI
ncbi:MAG: phosphoribosylformylglycinamidine synthase subunit PurQ [SAR324 cluster bacterium]|nr:phosphoribosylformylglycinamidine synthase subunit PurQ [SAR324 cluster bacterium]